MCSVWVCGVCWCVFGVLLVLCGCGVVVCVVVVCRTHSQDHGVHIRIDVHVGVTQNTYFHDVCFSEPLAFHNGFMFFASRS